MNKAIQIKQVVVRDILLNYCVIPNAGQTAGTILFLHGWGADSTIWFPIMQELVDRDLTLYGIDFPGFGKSEMPPKAFSVDDYAETVKEFIQKLELKNCFIVAHSFGGRVAIKLTARYPDLIQKLVLVDSAGIPLKTKKLSFKQSIIRVVRPLLHLRLLHFLRPYAYRWFASEDYLAYPYLRETFIKVVNEDLTPILPRINIKTLLIWGENDKDTPLVAAKIMQKNIPYAQLVVLKNTGHFSFLDDKQGFLKALQDFLFT